MSDHPAYGNRAKAFETQDKLEETATALTALLILIVSAVVTLTPLSLIGLQGFAPFTGVVILSVVTWREQRAEMKKFNEALKELHVRD